MILRLMMTSSLSFLRTPAAVLIGSLQRSFLYCCVRVEKVNLQTRYIWQSTGNIIRPYAIKIIHFCLVLSEASNINLCVLRC